MKYPEVKLVGAGRIRSLTLDIDYEDDYDYDDDDDYYSCDGVRERELAKAVSKEVGIPAKYLTMEFLSSTLDWDNEEKDEWVDLLCQVGRGHNRYDPDDREPQAVRALIDPEYVAQVENSHKVLEEDFYKMKNDTDTTDFVLKTSSGTKVFPVHKAILSNRSNVFRAMFTSNMAEDASGEAIIEDLDEETLEELIHFLYTGGLSEYDIRTYDILSLCNAANKYELASLMNLVRLNLMTTELDVGQLADLFIASEMFSQEGLFEVAREKLAEGEGGIEAKDVLEKIKDRPELTNKILELELF